MRKVDDGTHIDVAELDAIVKGLNLAIKWQLKKIRLVTDSATVHGWLQSLLTANHRIKVKVKGMEEMLMRRRLAMISELREEHGLDINVELVKSASNWADALTCVPQTWLKESRPCLVEELHRRHHFGVSKSLCFASQVDPAITHAEVKTVVESCKECASIDPAPTR